MNKFLSEAKLLSDGRYRLTEKLVINRDSIIKKNTLKEETEKIGNSFLPIFGSYLIKVWSKNTFNKNGRNYSKVFNKVLIENKVTIGFVNHPNDSEESYKDVCLVAKNPQIVTDEMGEEWLAVYITLVGRPYGENFEAVLESGGFLEFSSAADGNVDDNGYVEVEGFELLRWADIVVYSSNGQLFFKDKGNIEDIPLSSKPDNIIYDTKEEMTESIKEEVKEDLTIYNKEKEIHSMENKLLEKVLETNIRAMIKDADKTENLEERKTILLNALENATSLTESTIKNDVSSKLAETEKAILELAEKGKKVDSLEESVNTLSQEKESMSKDIEQVKAEKKDIEDKYNTLTELYEKKQYKASEGEIQAKTKLQEEKDVLIGNIASLKKTVASLNTEIKTLKAKNSLIEKKASIKEAIANTKVDAEIVSALKKDLDYLTEELISAKKTIRILRGQKIEEKEVVFNKRPSQFQTLLKKRLEEKKKEQEENTEKLEKTVEKEVMDVDVNKITTEKGLF